MHAPSDEIRPEEAPEPAFDGAESFWDPALIRLLLETLASGQRLH
jgi:hypothetical protein